MPVYSASNAAIMWKGSIGSALGLPGLLSIALILIVVLPVAHFIIRHKRLNLPIADLQSYDDNHKALTAATLKYPNTPFILPLPTPLVILPISTLEEVRNLPESRVSFGKEVRRMFAHRHTGIGEDIPALIQTIKIDLTRNIASTLNDLQEEIRYSFDKELGSCEDWTPVILYKALARIVALLSGRVFVGLPISRDEDWIGPSINYAMNCDLARRELMKYPTWIQTFVAPFLPAVQRLKQNKAKGSHMLEPVLQSVLKRKEHDMSEKVSGDHTLDEQGTFFSWILGRIDNPLHANPTEMYNYQMTLAFAAIHTTTQTTWHALFDLAARPQYIQPLRDEIQNVIDEDGVDEDSDGFPKLKKSSMPKLKKLDSFLKESQRLSPPGLISMIRVTTAPLTLSTGHTLPTGTRFAFPAYPIHTSTSTPTFSPALNPPETLPPTQFDGNRFVNLRSVPGQETRHQFVSTSPDSLNFGHGNHACPGRFFASNEIKVVLIELLRNWDIRLKGDVEGMGGEDKRPKNVNVQMSVSPNFGAEMEFRRRTEKV
ncbi:cytochrome P450 [Bisporella sp. PMI_857]|nr:cytochrome P450 [Bisporella sp. PMI_857]